MEKIYKFWETWFLPNLAHFQKNEYLVAIRHSFFVILPFLVVADIMDLLGHTLLEPAGFLFGERGLNLTDDTVLHIVESIRTLSFVGNGISTLMLALLLSYNFAKIKQVDTFLIVCCSLCSIIVASILSADGAISANYFEEYGCFSAFFVAVIVVFLFAWLSKKDFLILSIPESIPKELAHYFSLIIPFSLTILIFDFIAVLAEVIQPSADTFSQSIFQNPLFVMFYQTIVWILWWIGIPGYGITSIFQKYVYIPAQVDNQLGNSMYIFTNSFFDASSIHVMSLIIAIVVFSQNANWRSTAKFSFPAMLFNIPEVFIFSLPVVLNPVFLVPYLIAPVANALVGYVAISWGIVPIFQQSLSSSIPLILSATISTQSIMGGVLQIVWLVLDIFIYAPFVIVSNTMNSVHKESESS